MNWGEATLQWLHILFGTLWFGGALFANLVVVPSIMRLPGEPQQQFLKVFAAQSERVMLIAASGAIVLGFLRGTVFGDIKGVADLGTPYGIYWLIGLVAACLTYAYGTWILGPRGKRLGAEMAAAGVGQAVRCPRSSPRRWTDSRAWRSSSLSASSSSSPR